MFGVSNWKLAMYKISCVVKCAIKNIIYIYIKMRRTEIEAGE